MADLNTTPASGNQATTQNPQAAPSGQGIAGASAKSSSVQPGTSKELLNGQNGLSLSNSSLTTVSLSNTSTGSTIEAKPVQTAQKPAHHYNAAFFTVSIMLVVAAIGLFWAINRSAKNTTD